MRGIGDEEKKYVGHYEGVICVWCSSRPNACPDGQYHSLTIDLELLKLNAGLL